MFFLLVQEDKIQEREARKRSKLIISANILFLPSLLVRVYVSVEDGTTFPHNVVLDYRSDMTGRGIPYTDIPHP